MLFAMWATCFWYLVVHRQDLVALANGLAVIGNHTYGVGSATVGPTSSVRLHIYVREIYDWNIVDCDVKQPIHLTDNPKGLIVRLG